MVVPRMRLCMCGDLVMMLLPSYAGAGWRVRGGTGENGQRRTQRARRVWRRAWRDSVGLLPRVSAMEREWVHGIESANVFEGWGSGRGGRIRGCAGDGQAAGGRCAGGCGWTGCERAGGAGASDQCVPGDGFDADVFAREYPADRGTAVRHGALDVAVAVARRDALDVCAGERRIQGFRSTHQLSPWLADYGQAVFLPFSGDGSTDLVSDPGARAASYRPEDARIRRRGSGWS